MGAMDCGLAAGLEARAGCGVGCWPDWPDWPAAMAADMTITAPAARSLVFTNPLRRSLTDRPHYPARTPCDPMCTAHKVTGAAPPSLERISWKSWPDFFTPVASRTGGSGAPPADVYTPAAGRELTGKTAGQQGSADRFLLICACR